MSKTDTISILSLLFEEWKYRHENFWKRLIQFTVITFFTTTLPITFKIFPNLTLPDLSLYFFPICGIVLAVLGLLLCWAENSRLVATTNIIEKIMYDDLNIKKESVIKFEDEKLQKIIKKVPFSQFRIGEWLPFVITVLQFGLALLMIYLICKQKINPVDLKK